MRSFILLSIFVSVSLSAQSWPAFKTSFGAFYSQPRTQEEAESQGWMLLNENECSGKFLGNRLAHPEDDSIILIFDDAGFIAGSQSVVPASVADASAMARNPAYQLDYWFEMDAYLTTMYFVDPSIICNGGRSKDMFEDQGTGDRLVIQVGETAIENLVSLPLSKAEAAADPAWFDHYCFVGMGDHFIQFDYTPDQDCQLVLPLQLLFDDGYDGIINGFVWQHFVNIGGLASTRWEHPDSLAIWSIVDRPPQCMWDALDTTGLSTMHHYFWDYPLLIVCPLKYEKTVRGYRNLMASILEK